MCRTFCSSHYSEKKLGILVRGIDCCGLETQHAETLVNLYSYYDFIGNTE